jgi:hypothetical protein
MVYIKRKNILFLVLLFSLLLIIPTSIFAKEDLIAFFGKVKGDVTVTRANPGETEPAKAGMFLYSGDAVKTGDKSYTDIIFQDDGSRLKLDPNTTLTLEATRSQKRLSKKLSLGAGKMFAKVSKQRGTDFEVTTPTSVASVKGTDFGIEEKTWPETHLWVLSDIVEFTNGIQTIIVTAGQHAVATPKTIEVSSIGEAGCELVESGSHKLRFEFEDETGNVKDLIIEFERE